LPTQRLPKQQDEQQSIACRRRQHRSDADRLRPTPHPELATEGAGAFQALVDALTALQGDRVVRGDNILLMARFVWAVVHGVAMLAIDGQLPEAGGIEELMRYALERLQTGIEGIPRLGRRTPSV
jgi:Tetracyclin repressor-like, C-terminal domain